MVSANDPTPIICVRDFGKRYGRRQTIGGVSLEVKRGEVFGLIGPDGAGKSSLMKAIAGVLTYNRGVIDVLGVRIDSERSAERIKGRIGFMPQGLGMNLYPELSIEENIDFMAQLRLVPPEQLADRKQRLLTKTGLNEFRDRPMKFLSGGMKQKLGLVCSFIHQPELVILDEPTTGVDPVSRRDFWSLLTDLVSEEGITALVSTAYMDEATRFHRIGLMFQGRMLACDTPDGILSLAPGTVIGVQTGMDARAVDTLKVAFPQVTAQGAWVHIFIDEVDQTAAIEQVTAVLRPISIRAIHAETPELEDVFVALLRREDAQTCTAPIKLPPLPTTTAKSDDAVIEAQSLVREFGRFRAVDQVSFRVRQGELFGLLGANGAGKTTVIKMLTGILPPTSGVGHVAGADMRHAGYDIKERIGYMSQAFSLYQDLTPLENVRLYAGIYGLSRRAARERTEWVIDMAGLSGFERQPARRLPMGLRQRLALGCALVHRPRVLFLDEPTSGVDPIGRRTFWDILFHLARTESVAILVTTHYMSEAEHCDHLVLMHAGRVISDASPERLKEEVEREAGQLLEVSTDQPLPVLQVLRRAGLSGAALFGSKIRLLTKEIETAENTVRRSLAAQDIRLLGMSIRPLSMEDVFVYRVLAQGKREKQRA